MTAEKTVPRAPSLGLALVPVVLTLLVLALQLFYFDHIRNMMPTTVPARLIALGIYA